MMTKNVKCGRLLAAVAGLICGMATLQAALVYNNPLSDPTYAGPLYVTADQEVIGSQIILDLTGSPGFIPYKFKFYYYLANDLVNQGHVVSAQVKFLQNDGGSSEPNTAIWASDVFAIPFTGIPSSFLFTELEFNSTDYPDLLTSTVASTFTWTVQFTGLQLNDHAGVALAGQPDGGPAVGEYYTGYWYSSDGASTWTYLNHNPQIIPTVSFAGYLEVVPEPPVGAIAGVIGLAAVMFVRHARRSTRKG
jgi:hypothetical protein